MIQRRTFIQTVISAAIGLSLIACAEQERKLTLSPGLYKIMTAEEVKEKGFDRGGNQYVFQAPTNPLLISTYAGKEIGIETIKLSKDLKTLEANTLKLNYTLVEIIDKADEIGGMLVVPKADGSSNSLSEVFKGKKGTYRLDNASYKPGPFNSKSEIVKIENPDTKIIRKVKQIDNSTILVTKADVQMLDGKEITLDVDSTYYRAVFAVELEAIEKALLSEDKRMAALAKAQDLKLNPKPEVQEEAVDAENSEVVDPNAVVVDAEKDENAVPPVEAVDTTVDLDAQDQLSTAAETAIAIDETVIE